MTHEKEIKELIEAGEKARDVTWRYSERLRAIISPLERFEPIIANVVSLPEYEDNGKFIEKAANSRDAIKAMYEENQSLKKRIAELKKVDKWQPIETAPHGVWILIYAHGCVMQACWNANGWWEAYMGTRIMQHYIDGWTPLPTPPEEKE